MNKSVSEQTRNGQDRQANLWSPKDILIEFSKVNVDNNHFWCIVCHDIRPLDIAEGVIANFNFCGWLCADHINQGK